MVPGAVEGRLVGQRDEHDEEVVQGQPLEQALALRAQRVPAPEQEQRQRQVGGVDDVILNRAQRDHSYEQDIRVVPGPNKTSILTYLSHANEVTPDLATQSFLRIMQGLPLSWQEIHTVSVVYADDRLLSLA